MIKEIIAHTSYNPVEYDISNYDRDGARELIRSYFEEGGKIGTMSRIAEIEDMILELDSLFPGVIAEVAAEMGFYNQDEMI